MNDKPTRKGNTEPLTPQQAADLAALEAMPEETIDTSDIPEARDWSGAVRGKYARRQATPPPAPAAAPRR
jgi:hypothetical protein